MESIWCVAVGALLSFKETTVYIFLKIEDAISVVVYFTNLHQLHLHLANLRRYSGKTTRACQVWQITTRLKLKCEAKLSIGCKTARRIPPQVVSEITSGCLNFVFIRATEVIGCARTSRKNFPHSRANSFSMVHLQGKMSATQCQSSCSRTQ